MIQQGPAVAPDDGTPLGASNYLLYFDPYDYSFVNGATLASPGDDMTPRVGALGNLSPAASPTATSVGIGGRAAIDYGTTSNARLDAHGYAVPFAVANRVLSVAARIRRVGNESGCAIGAGRASATASCIELAHSAAGYLTIRIIDAAGTAKSYTSATAQLDFVAHTIGFSIRAGGLLVDCYLDGVLVADLSGLDFSVAVGQDPLITQFRVGTTGRSTGGTDDFAGVIGQVAIGLAGVTWTAAQHLTTHNYWVALQPPAAVGTPIYSVGDSMTKCPSQHGWRGYIQDQFVANAWGFDWQGSASDGNWADNQHSGYSGRTLAQVQARATAECGTGKPYSLAKLAFLCMVGTNDGNAGDPTAAIALAAYATCLEALHTALVSTVAAARIVVATLPNFNPAASTYTWQQAFNAGLPAAWNTFDAAHPSNKVFRADVAAAVGAWNNPTYYLDDAHLNNAGNQLAGAAIYSCSDAAANTLAAYLLSIKT